MNALTLIKDELKQSKESQDFKNNVSAMAKTFDYVTTEEKETVTGYFSFLLGNQNNLPESLPEYLSYKLGYLDGSIHSESGFTDRDKRIIKAYLHKSWRKEGLENFLLDIAGTKIVAIPEKDILGEIITLLNNLKIDIDDVMQKMLTELSYAYVTKEGEITSLGRWVLKQTENLDLLFEKIEAGFEQQDKSDDDDDSDEEEGDDDDEMEETKDEIKLEIANLLQRAKSENLRDYLQNLSLNDSENWPTLVKYLLQTDAGGYQQLALDLGKKVQSAKGKYLLGRHYRDYLKEEQKELVIQLMAESMEGLQNQGYNSYETRLELADFVMTEFPNQAEELLKNYKEPNLNARIKYFSLIGKKLGHKYQKGQSLLMNALAGEITKEEKMNCPEEKYYRAILSSLQFSVNNEILEKVWKQLADHSKKQVREITGRFFAKTLTDPIPFTREKISKGNAREKYTAIVIYGNLENDIAIPELENVSKQNLPKDALELIAEFLHTSAPVEISPSQAFHFDTYADKAGESAFKTILENKQKMNRTISELWFTGYGDGFPAAGVNIVFTNHENLSMEIKSPPANFPESEEQWYSKTKKNLDNKILAGFVAKYKLKKDPEPIEQLIDLSIGLYTNELANKALDLLEQLKSRGFEVIDKPTAGFAWHDESDKAGELEIEDEQQEIFRSRAMSREYAAICFQKEQNQKRLLQILQAP